MTSRKNIQIFDFNGVNVAKHWHVAGEVFAISDCLVEIVLVVREMCPLCVYLYDITFTYNLHLKKMLQ